MTYTIQRIQDKYNPAKTWLIKRTACRHTFISQEVSGQRLYPFKRLGIAHARMIGLEL